MNAVCPKIAKALTSQKYIITEEELRDHTLWNVAYGQTSDPQKMKELEERLDRLEFKIRSHSAPTGDLDREKMLEKATEWLFEQFKQFTNGKYTFGDDWLADWWIERVGYLRTPEGEAELQQQQEREHSSLNPVLRKR